MDLLNPLIPAQLAWLLNLAALVIVVLVARATDFKRLAGFQRVNAWLVTIAFVAMLWAIRADVQSGLNLHLSGAVLFALVYGWRLSIIGMAAVVVIMTTAGRIMPLNAGLQFFLHGLYPVSVGYGIFLLSEAFLARNFFVYVFVPGFFGPWLATAALAFATSILLVAFGAYTFAELSDAFLPFYLILGFSEGFITGFIVTLLAVYKPEWLYTFRDERYITGK